MTVNDLLPLINIINSSFNPPIAVVNEDKYFRKRLANNEVNKLIKYLGGKDNIISTEINMSRFKVTLKDVSKANKEGIQKLGAKGIVEIDNELKIILGPNSKQLKNYMADLKK